MSIINYKYPFRSFSKLTLKKAFVSRKIDDEYRQRTLEVLNWEFQIKTFYVLRDQLIIKVDRTVEDSGKDITYANRRSIYISMNGENISNMCLFADFSKTFRILLTKYSSYSTSNWSKSSLILPIDIPHDIYEVYFKYFIKIADLHYKEKSLLVENIEKC